MQVVPGTINAAPTEKIPIDLKSIFYWYLELCIKGNNGWYFLPHRNSTIMESSVQMHDEAGLYWVSQVYVLPSRFKMAQ